MVILLSTYFWRSFFSQKFQEGQWKGPFSNEFQAVLMTSVLSSLFSRDPKASFAYELPATADQISVDGISRGKSFKKVEPSELATCFWTTSEGRSHRTLKAQAQKLKTLRHPNVLTYLDSIEVDGKLYLITERCLPLQSYMEASSLSGRQKEFIVSWGLFQLMSCLKFLHDEAKIMHGDVKHSVYVTEGGDWKLGGFEKSTAFSNSRLDLNSLAVLMWEIFNGFIEKATRSGSSNKIPRRLQSLYEKANSSQAARFNTGDLLRECRRAGGFFKNRFVDTLLFLDEFQLKDAPEKQAFFSRLNNELDIFPDNIAKYRILPKLIQSYEYGNAGSQILMPLLRLGRLLAEEEYQRCIVPCLCKLFSSPDRVTRVKLLERMDEFVPHLSSEIVNDKIFKNIESGFLDTNPAVRESTVKAVVSLAGKLDKHNLNSVLMKHLARLQGSDEHPGIRTNTTICLGKVSCYIDASQRQDILICAFTRALKDPFPAARVAAILAISATQQYYSLIEVANRILPALAHLTCDPEKQVRDQTFKALHGFIDKLEKASKNPDIIPELEAQVMAGGSSGLLSSDKVPQWASWALKSLSGKFYKSSAPPSTQEKAMKHGETTNRELTPSVDSSSSLKKEEEKRQEDDDWGSFHDDNNEDREELWENAVAGESAVLGDGDGWDAEWNSIDSTEEKPVLNSQSAEQEFSISRSEMPNVTKVSSLDSSTLKATNCMNNVSSIEKLVLRTSLTQADSISVDAFLGQEAELPALPKRAVAKTSKTVKGNSSLESGWSEFMKSDGDSKTESNDLLHTEMSKRHGERRREPIVRRKERKGMGAMRLPAKQQ